MGFTVEFRDGTVTTVDLAVTYKSDGNGTIQFFGEPDDLYVLAMDFGVHKPSPTPVLELPSDQIKQISTS